MDEVASSKAAASSSDAAAASGAGDPQRWSSAVSNVCEIQSGFDMLQRLLLKQTVYKDEEAFAHASSSATQARHIMAQERRIRTLEKELDAAVASAALARADKRVAESAQRAAEAKTQEVLQELENTTRNILNSHHKQTSFFSKASHSLWVIVHCHRSNMFFYFLCNLHVEVFKLHMEELRAKQEELQKKDAEVKALKAMIDALGGGQQ